MIHKNCILRILYNRRKATNSNRVPVRLVICWQRVDDDGVLLAADDGWEFIDRKQAGLIQITSFPAITDSFALRLVEQIRYHDQTTIIIRTLSSFYFLLLLLLLLRTHTDTGTLAFLCFRSSLKLNPALGQKITQLLPTASFIYFTFLCCSDQIFRFNLHSGGARARVGDSHSLVHYFLRVTSSFSSSSASSSSSPCLFPLLRLHCTSRKHTKKRRP